MTMITEDPIAIVRHDPLDEAPPETCEAVMHPFMIRCVEPQQFEVKWPRCCNSPDIVRICSVHMDQVNEEARQFGFNTCIKCGAEALPRVRAL